MIFINTSQQKLYLLQNNNIECDFKISTAFNGIGCNLDSNKTPIGLHTVVSKIGDGLPAGTLFKNRIPTNKVINKIPNDNKDYITSRIIRLGGLEEGINKGGNVDTFQRLIYIHGTPHIDKLGYPESHGCIRMGDDDVICLYKLINRKMLVLIY
jgi:lipoprotein-anchoring transpeptidase ErfK/SrfK